MDMVAELDAHLLRLAVWSGFWLAVGSVGFARTEDVLKGFFGLSAAWCVVNLLIVLGSQFGPPPDSLPAFREFLMLNQGLNVGYMGVGVTLLIVAPKPFARGAGVAVALQGLALLALDGFLLSRLSV